MSRASVYVERSSSVTCTLLFGLGCCLTRQPPMYTPDRRFQKTIILFVSRRRFSFSLTFKTSFFIIRHLKMCHRTKCKKRVATKALTTRAAVSKNTKAHSFPCRECEIENSERQPTTLFFFFYLCPCGEILRRVLFFFNMKLMLKRSDIPGFVIDI